MRRSRPKPLVLVVAAIALLGASAALPGRSVTAFAAAGTPPAPGGGIAPGPATTPGGGSMGGRADGRGGRADLVIHGGPIYTMDAVRTWAEAIAIKGEKIVYVGSSRGAAAFIVPDKTRVLDLQGRMLLPAFQDAHIHPIAGGLSYSIGCALYDLGKKEEYARHVAECAQTRPPGAWVRGDGWAMSAFAPTGIPDRRLLDAAVPDRPVYLESADGHSAWVNTRALQLAGITRDTPDPAGGRIDRDPKTGEAVGSLQDGAMSLVSSRIPPYTPDERKDGLRYALRMLNRFGITSFQDANVVEDDLQTYRDLDAKDELTARVVASLWWERGQGLEQIPRFIDQRRRYTHGHLRATTVKIMQDGVMEVQTAALLKPYLGKGGQKGLTMIEPAALNTIVTALDREGFQVHFHAIGDAAIRECLDAVQAARRVNGARDSRHHIAHLELFDPADIARFRQLGVIANFQPLWAFADGYIKDLTLPFLEPERQRWIYPIRSLLASGAVVAFGSDWSVSSANPLEEIEVAVTRMGPAGETKTPFIPEERIDLRDALAAFTLNAAYVNFQDDRTGSIEEGKLADLIVLDHNLFAMPPDQISSARVVLTLLGGKPVWGDWSLSASATAGGGS
ncbi:MAG TPA: amidohydrolase [Patescibacteria group bacterium]|nr:amidohydrolase [Patescibacteria group bacterium]